MPIKHTFARMRKRFALFFGLVFAVMAFTPNALADYAKGPPSPLSPQIVTHGVFVNAYLYFPSRPGETWEQHLAALKGNTRPFNLESRALIDRFVSALTKSSYFDTLAQYGKGGSLNPQVINPPIFAGQLVTYPVCLRPLLQHAKRVGGDVLIPYGGLQHGGIHHFAGCEKSQARKHANNKMMRALYKRAIVNIVVSPDVRVKFFGLNQKPTCRRGIKVSGWHGWYPNYPNFTVIPTNKVCNATFSSLANTLSHEMVEVLSDPRGMGYTHGPHSGHLYIPDWSNELGDICEGGPHRRYPSGNEKDVAFPVGEFAPLGVLVSRYWSNVDNDCEPRFIMNRTLYTSVAAHRFPRRPSDWDIGMRIRPADNRLLVHQIELLVRTGHKGLGGGCKHGIDAFVVLRNGSRIPFYDINANHHWSRNNMHVANLHLSRSVRASDIQGIRLHSKGQSWDVSHLVVKAALGP